MNTLVRTYAHIFLQMQDGTQKWETNMKSKTCMFPSDMNDLKVQALRESPRENMPRKTLYWRIFHKKSSAKISTTICHDGFVNIEDVQNYGLEKIIY